METAEEARRRFIEADLHLLWQIQDWVYRRPWLDARLAQIVSIHPWQDICAVPWLVAAIGVYDIGVRHFWIVAVNLATAYFARQLLQAKRPVEYDERLQPMTDLHAESYGLPSLETHMAVVILLHFSVNTAFLYTIVPSIFLILLVGFSRVYTRSRFPHQILISFGTGVAGFILGGHCCEQMQFHSMSHFQHSCCASVAVLSILANFSLAIENNDSRLVYIPKKEFLRVMVGIINSSGDSGGAKELRAEFQPEPDDSDANDVNESSFADTRMGGLGSKIPQTPRSVAARQAKLAAPTVTGRRPKRDSFHFLQRQLEARTTMQRKRLDTGGRDLYFASTPRSLQSDSEAEHIA